MILTPLAFAVATAAAGWSPLTLDIIDAILISFSLGSAALFSPRLVLTLYNDGFDATDYVTFGLYDLFLYALLAGVWSVRARSNHGPAIYQSDIEIRIAFRFLAARSIVYIMIAQGFDNDHMKPTVAKWLRALAVGIVGITLLAGVNIAVRRYQYGVATALYRDHAPRISTFSDPPE